MTLQSGALLGSYEILSLLGSGGMEVYQAKDLKLGRNLAVIEERRNNNQPYLYGNPLHRVACIAAQLRDHPPYRKLMTRK
jgi:hypothetical protein